MSLNIKSERVHALVREAARRTGSSQVSAVETAVTEYLQRLDRPNAAAERQVRLERLLAEIDASMTDDDRIAIRRGAEEMYDEAGLPR